MSPTLRRGLPRVPGGEPWPPADTAAPATSYVLKAAGQASAPAAPAPAEVSALVEAPVAAVFRRGLPRVPGGEPWPPAEAAPQGLAATVSSGEALPPAVTVPAESTESAAAEAPVDAPAAPAADSAPAAEPVAGAAVAPGAVTSGDARIGLPRVAGEDGWPAAGTIVQNAFTAAPTVAAPVEAAPARITPAATAPAPTPVPTPAPTPTPAPAARPAAQPTAAAAAPAAKPEVKKYGLFTIKQWIGVGAIVALAVVGAVTLVVLAARWFTGLDFMQSFLAKYPGEYALPESAPVGFPGWLGWQHFFNIFLMVLIIRSGLLVRRQERPEAFWASKKNPKKISIQLWLHQSLNLLWVVNGLIFLILLFATGQWMRVIPTSPEVFPNALSAGLQYLTLDWPVDNGWVNYNSLQQLAYFTTIFIAAPLSAITGFRMSESWPRDSKLSEKFKVEWARALHFPLMIYFVGFIVVHVALVFSTGALRNLNHMFAAQGSPDPSVYANNWVGFWLFVLSMLVVTGGWIAARPMIMAPIARIFGNVSAR